MSNLMNHPIRRAWRYAFDRGIIIIDAFTLFASGLTTWYLLQSFYSGPVLSLKSTLILLGYFTVIILLTGVIIGLYRAPFYRNAKYQIVLLTKTYLYGLSIVMVSFYIFRMVFVPRIYTTLFILLAPVHVWVGRSIMLMIQRKLAHWGMGNLNVLIVSNSHAGEIDREIGYQWLAQIGYDLRGFIETNLDKEVSKMGTNMYPHYPLDGLRTVVEREGIDRIFIPSTNFSLNGLEKIVTVGREKGIKIKVISSDAVKLLRTSRVYDVAGITLHKPPRPYYQLYMNFATRLFDIVGTTVLLLLLSPIYLFTALAVAMDSKGPIIYSQRRAALKGQKPFNFYKFRSMVFGAEKMQADLANENESSGPLFKMTMDPRVTRIGRFIRRYSIDELPQLFNVLKGDMSLVGPRPLPLVDLENPAFENVWDAIRERGSVRPGVTGLWQISGRSDISFNDMILLDLYYIEHHSIAFDLEIIFETIPAILFGKGAY